VQSYLNIARNLQSDAVLVDTFLHGRERSYTVDDCIDFVTFGRTGVSGWFLEGALLPARLVRGAHPVYPAVNALPERRYGR